MTKRFLSDVRDQLTSRATQTTLHELHRRGLEQVRVIRSSQILQLIEEAVDRALSDRGIQTNDAERAQVVQASTQNFRDAISHRPQDEEAEGLRKRLQEVEGALVESHRRMELLQQKLAAARDLNPPPSVPVELMEEIRALRREVESSARHAAPAVAAPGVDTRAIEETLHTLSTNLGREIEKIGRKVGITSVEETPTDLSGLFQDIPEAENNLDAVEAVERKGGDVNDVVARMKSLRRST